jgi:hypothetical protein
VPPCNAVQCWGPEALGRRLDASISNDETLHIPEGPTDCLVRFIVLGTGHASTRALVVAPSG